MCAHHILSYHLIYVPWHVCLANGFYCCWIWLLYYLSKPATQTLLHISFFCFCYKNNLDPDQYFLLALVKYLPTYNYNNLLVLKHIKISTVNFTRKSAIIYTYTILFLIQIRTYFLALADFFYYLKIYNYKDLLVVNHI